MQDAERAQDGAAVADRPEVSPAPEPTTPPAYDRSVVVARLRPGRALLALAAPVAVGLLLVTAWDAVDLLRAGAVVRDGVLAAASVQGSLPPVRLVVSLLVVELAALWGVGAALTVLALEAARLPVPWRAVATWPRRYPAAALALAGTGLLLQLAAAGAFAGAAALLVRVEVPGGPVLDLALATLAAAVAVAVLQPLVRRSARLLVVGSWPRPGVVDAPDAWGQDSHLGRVALLGGVVVGGAGVLLTWQRSALGLPVWAASALLLALAAAAVLAVLALVVDDATRGLDAPVRTPLTRARTRRWAAGTAVLLAPVLVPALLVALVPSGLVRYQQLDTGTVLDVPVASAGGDVLMLQDAGTWYTSKTALCQGSRCVDTGIGGRRATAVSEDGSLLWVARWSSEGYTVDEKSLTLAAYRPGDLAHVAVSDSTQETERDGEWLLFPDAEPVTDLTVVAEPGATLAEPDRERFDRAPIAVAERDGVVVVAASYTLDRLTTGPLFLARCTADDGCDVTQTAHTLAPVADEPVLDVAIGPDGTAYATAYGSTLGPGRAPGTDPVPGSDPVPGGLALLVQTPDGALTTRQIDPGTEGAEYATLAGADVAVADDGTVWLLLRQREYGTARLLRCADATCSSWDTIELEGVSQGMGTLAVDATGRPLIATSDPDRRELAVLSCVDDACGTVERRVLASDAGLRPVALVLRGGRPVVAVLDPPGAAGGSRALACTDARCGAR